MILVSSKDIYKIDEYAVQLGITPIQLMENAGGNAARIIDEHIPEESNILIVCGKGHNGGDGYVVARHLFKMGHMVTILPVNIPAKSNDPTYVNYNICKNIGIKFTSKVTPKYTVIIDAILGVGAKLPLRGIIPDIIDKMNYMYATKIAIDIPTGINGDTGEADEIYFQADFTVTMELEKIGMYITPGKFACGKIYVADIGIPRTSYPKLDSHYSAVKKPFIEAMLAERNDLSNKGSFGKVLAIGGSPNYSGAIIFSASAAVKSGAGLVYIAVPDVILNTVSINVPDAIKFPLKSNEDGTISSDNDNFINSLNKFDAILMGPGIGTNPKTWKFMLKVINIYEGPLILDADALRIIPLYGKKLGYNILITPHPGEAAPLLNATADEINERRLHYTRKLVKKLGCNLLLKGNGTIITDGKDFFINTSGNNTLARGGSGDVLSGMILAFLGNKREPIPSAIISAYLHGLAGEIAGKSSHGYSVSINDILNSITKAFECIFS